jgi:CO/xanthine dehydrogenase Mo-binding subunit
MVVGGTIARAVTAARDQLLNWLAQREGVGGPLRVHDGEITGESGFRMRFGDAVTTYVAENGPLELTLRNEPPEWQQFDDATYQGVAYATYAWGADVVEVEVDAETLEIRPVEATVVCEVGKAIHRKLCVGQIEGGTLQAVAWAYMEEVKLENGRYLNDRLATYIIPTAKDSPRIRVHLLERPYEGGPFGAKGVGELPMDGGAPATVGAIENATGIVPDEIPATPERLLRWSLGRETVSGRSEPFGEGAR